MFDTLTVIKNRAMPWGGTAMPHHRHGPVLALCLILAGIGLPGHLNAARAQTPPPPSSPAADTGTRGIIVLRPVAPAVEPAPAPVVAPVPAPPPPPPPVEAAQQPCRRPFDHPEVRLTGAEGFAAALRHRLARRHGPVVVDLAQPSPIGAAMPAELAPWLRQVKSSGGTVTVDSYCAQSRGLFGMFRGLFGAGTPDGYAAADGYDAVLHVDGAVAAVTQVEFKPRAGS